VEPWEADVEPFATFAHRDYLRQLYGGGWHGRLDAILRAASDPESIERYQQGYTLERTKVALFKSHLWLRAYMTEHDALPVSWEQITDSGLPPLPADPWTAAGQPLRYRTTAKGYVLYSVGPDGVDNGGAKPASATFAGLRRGGDYHIDLFGRD
jgi:hypothetical protein